MQGLKQTARPRTTRWALPMVMCVAATAGADTKVYKHDELSTNANDAANELATMPLGVQPGFAMGEAFGAVFTPAEVEYPVKIQSVQLIMAAPPNGAPAAAKADADIEVYLFDGPGPDPGKEPDFVLGTSDVFNPASGDFGFPLQGGAALVYEFDWAEPDGHPPMVTSGKFMIAVRFKNASSDLQAEWGTPDCAKMQIMELETCGCQQVAAITDTAVKPEANVMSIIDPPGKCSGGKKWYWADKLGPFGGVKGDFVIRAVAETAGSVCEPQCGSKECGDDGCGATCGSCAAGSACKAGKCVACSCDGKECGDDGCGSSCGSCPEGKTCQDGACAGGACSCDGKACGDDGCGTSCGTCGAGEKCSGGKCVDEAVTCTCEGKACGDDGCGTSCGMCPAGKTCTANACVGETAPGELLVEAVTPSSGYNDRTTEVSVAGKGFQVGLTAKLGSVALGVLAVHNERAFSAIVPSDMDPGMRMLIVENPDGSAATLPDAFEVLAPLAVVEPSVTGPRSDGGGCASVPARRPAPWLLLLALLLGILARRRVAP